MMSGIMRRLLVSFHVVLFLLVSTFYLRPLSAQAQKNDTVKRPAIIGVAHIGLKTYNMGAAREFYGHVLGYQEPFTLNKPSGGLMLTYFKVNDHQYIEVFPD